MKVLAAGFMIALLAVTAGTPIPAARCTEIGRYWSDRPYLRKLHLVRPDLIWYPLAVEIYC